MKILPGQARVKVNMTAFIVVRKNAARVCVCVCILFDRESVFRLQDVWDILEGTDQRCCVVSIIRCAAAKFLHLGI